MKKTLKMSALAAVLSTTLMTGCATNQQEDGNPLANAAKGVGNAVTGLFQPYTNGVEVTDENLAQLEVGMTPAQVETIIGLPPEIDQSSTGEIWSYPFSKISHFSAAVNETTVVRFDKDGKVARAYKTGNRSSPSGNPLLDAANGQ